MTKATDANGCGPATSADLLELDAVPEPVDSDAPRDVHPPGCAPIGPSAATRPIRGPAVAAEQALRRKPTLANARAYHAAVEDDIHARTLARARD